MSAPADKMKLSDRAGDETIAEALRIAERRLIKQGWSHTSAEVGKTAAAIIAALDSKEDTPNA